MRREPHITTMRVARCAMPQWEGYIDYMGDWENCDDAARRDTVSTTGLFRIIMPYGAEARPRYPLLPMRKGGTHNRAAAMFSFLLRRSAKTA